MTSTPELIALLSANVRPVKRLRPPLVRASGWLLLALLILVLLGIGHGVRPNLRSMLDQPTFSIGLAAAVLTSALAACAAFLICLPDRSRLWSLLPLPAFALWMSTIGYQCLTNWVVFDPAGMHLGETARCLATLVLTSLPLSLAMLAMLRFAAPLRPANAILLGSLAVAGVTAAALSLFHPLDATMMVLMFNVGTAVLFLLIGSFFQYRFVASE